MGNEVKVTTRTFSVKEGMTAEDVRKSPNATAQQKKMADVFDSDGIKGYSKREADVFNATVISDHGKNVVSLWTKFADGSRKETLVKGDLKAIKYAPEGKIKSIAYKEGKLTTKMIKSSKISEVKFVKDKDSNLKYPANYIRVEVGKGGIVSSDTTHYTGTDKPKYINYRNKNKKTPVYEYFDENGQFKYSVKQDFDYCPGREIPYTMYNAKGQKVAEGFYALNDDSKKEVFYERFFRDEKNPSHVTYSEDRDIKTGKLIEKYDNGNTYKYKLDGTYTTEKWGDGGFVIESYNSKDKLVKKQQLDYNNVLKYTIIPQYNKDGIVIKNDTIWNQQK